MRTRLLTAGILAAVLGLAALSFAAAQGPGESRGGAGYGSEELPPVVAFLQAVPRAQRFDHLRGTTISIVDQNGSPVAISYVPGTVSTVSGTSLVITPNGQTTTRTFNITPKTLFRGAPAAGSNSVVVPGDRVEVVTSGSGSDAVFVVKYAIPAPGTPSAAAGAATPAGATPTP